MPRELYLLAVPILRRTCTPKVHFSVLLRAQSPFAPSHMLFFFLKKSHSILFMFLLAANWFHLVYLWNGLYPALPDDCNQYSTSYNVAIFHKAYALEWVHKCTREYTHKHRVVFFLIQLWKNILSIAINLGSILITVTYR